MYISKQDVLFARYILSHFVNGRMHTPETVAAEMSRNHRYLQSEMFKLCLEYIRCLAINYEDNRYDGRNEWACEMAYRMLERTDELPTDRDKKEYVERCDSLYNTTVNCQYKKLEALYEN